MKKTNLITIALFGVLFFLGGCAVAAGSGGSSTLNPSYRPVFDTSRGIDNNKLLNDKIQCTALAREAVSSRRGIDPATGTLLGAGGGAAAGAIGGAMAGNTGKGAIIGTLVGGFLGYMATAQNPNGGADMNKLNWAYYNCFVGRGDTPINTP